MVVRIRMAMYGPRNNKIFHVVAINGQLRRDARPLETLGVYRPHSVPGETQKTVEWSVDRIRYWLDVGAVPSKSTVKLLELGGVISPDSKYHPKSRPVVVPITRTSAEKAKPTAS